MSASPMIDAQRLSLMLNELRLPAIKHMWGDFAARADREGWPAARLLAALAEHDDVVAGDQGPFHLRDDRRLEAHDARPGVAPLAECGQEVVAALVAHTALHVTAGTQFTQGSG